VTGYPRGWWCVVGGGLFDGYDRNGGRGVNFKVRLQLGEVKWGDTKERVESNSRERKEKRKRRGNKKECGWW
jgi:hypothetical protein